MSITLPDIRKACTEVEYVKCLDAETRVKTGWCHGVMGNGFYIQHQQLLYDCENLHRPPTWQKGRKFYCSSHMTKSELVQTMLMAILAFEEHEAREAFYFKGQRIFGPHINIDALGEASNDREVREEAHALSS